MTTSASSAPDLPRYADDLAEEIEDFQIPPRRTSRPAYPDRFIDRESSWLDFNARVLELAEDESVPLLERARFMALFATNLD